MYLESNLLDRTLAAISDSTRRSILERLRKGDARVTDIAMEFPISLNSVSKHIRILEKAELIERKIIGREHILKFQPSPLTAAQQWITEQQNFWTSKLEAIDRLLNAENTNDTNPLGVQHDHLDRS